MATGNVLFTSNIAPALVRHNDGILRGRLLYHEMSYATYKGL